MSCRLRPDGDRCSDVTVKRKMLIGIDKGKVLLVVEDRNRVVQSGAKRDWSACSVRPASFDFNVLPPVSKRASLAYFD